MKKILLLMGMAALFMMACSSDKKAEEKAKSFYEQRDSLYNDADEDVKCENWGVKEWLNFQKADMRIAIAFYESNPSVEDVDNFIINRKSFVNRIDDGFYQVNKRAYEATSIDNGVLNKKDFIDDSEALKLLDKLVRAHSSWMNAHGKEYDQFKVKKEKPGEVVKEDDFDDIEYVMEPEEMEVVFEEVASSDTLSEEVIQRWGELVPALKDTFYIIPREW